MSWRTLTVLVDIASEAHKDDERFVRPGTVCSPWKGTPTRKAIAKDNSRAQAKLQKLRTSASGTARLPHCGRPWPDAAPHGAIVEAQVRACAPIELGSRKSCDSNPPLASDFLEPRRRGWGDVRRSLPSLEMQPMHARSQVSSTPRLHHVLYHWQLRSKLKNLIKAYVR